MAIASFSRSFSFPTGIDADKSTASYENGEIVLYRVGTGVLRTLVPAGTGFAGLVADPEEARVAALFGSAREQSPQSGCKWELKP